MHNIANNSAAAIGESRSAAALQIVVGCRKLVQYYSRLI